MTPLVRQLVPRTRNAERYHWFDIGEMSNDVTTIDGSDPIASRPGLAQTSEKAEPTQAPGCTTGADTGARPQAVSACG